MAVEPFIFTNNLAISCVLTGADPFDSVTVSAGATNTQTRSTTDGSFSLTGTISGSDGSSRPYALKEMNDGTGTVNEDAYTGTKSVRCVLMPMTALKFRPGIISDITSYSNEGGFVDGDKVRFRFGF